MTKEAEVKDEKETKVEDEVVGSSKEDVKNVDEVKMKK